MMTAGRLPMRTLQTAVCTLEPQVAGHAGEMFALLGDPAIYEFENAPPASESGLRDRYARLEARQSDDGSQLWLNWVVRLASGELAGYVQATVIGNGVSFVAYELASRFWRQGIGRAAVTAMAHELVDRYGVHTLVAVLKAANFRSHGLLVRLGFRPASAEQAIQWNAEPDERVMIRTEVAPSIDGSEPTA